MPSAHTQETTPIEPALNQIITSKEGFVDLESVELELALDLQVLQDFGFEHCLQEACEASGFEFLFQLPIFDLNPGQRIAVLSAGTGGKLLYAVLNDAGTEIEIVPQDLMRDEIRSFAEAFTDVFSQLGLSKS